MKNPVAGSPLSQEKVSATFTQAPMLVFLESRKRQIKGRGRQARKTVRSQNQQLWLRNPPSTSWGTGTPPGSAQGQRGCWGGRGLPCCPLLSLWACVSTATIKSPSIPPMKENSLKEMFLSSLRSSSSPHIKHPLQKMVSTSWYQGDSFFPNAFVSSNRRVPERGVLCPCHGEVQAQGVPGTRAPRRKRSASGWTQCLLRLPEGSLVAGGRSRGVSQAPHHSRLLHLHLLN